MRGVEFSELTAFASIAEHRSFAKAAGQLGLSRSMLSQSLRALEERLKVRLMNRTTRSVSLTDAGNRLLARIRPMLGELTAAVEEARSSQHHLTGLLRLVVQPPVATFLIEPVMARFLAEFPGIRLDIKVVKMPADIVRDGFDAGIRLGEQIERDMIALRVMEAPKFVVVGSPEYLARHLPPKTPYELKRHDCIRNRLPNDTIFGWQFEKNRKSLQLNVDGRLVVNDIELSIRAVLDGLGLAYLLQDYIREHVKTGRLVALLEDWSPRLSGFYLYYSSRRQMGAPLQAFINFLAAEIETARIGKIEPAG